MLLANFDRKEHLQHRAVSLRQHGFLVVFGHVCPLSFTVHVNLSYRTITKPVYLAFMYEATTRTGHSTSLRSILYRFKPQVAADRTVRHSVITGSYFSRYAVGCGLRYSNASRRRRHACPIDSQGHRHRQCLAGTMPVR